MPSTKFLGPTGGVTSDAIRALDYLTDMKTRHPSVNIVAANNSWGGGPGGLVRDTRRRGSYPPRIGLETAAALIRLSLLEPLPWPLQER
jgi:hypothetical protein